MPATTKKIPFLWIVATAIVCIVITRGITLQSHSTNKETLLAIKRVDSSLIASNKMLAHSNTLISDEWHENQKKPELNAIAISLSLKIDTAIDLANKMVLKIEELKNELKKEARMQEKENESKENNLNVVNRLMIKKMHGEELKQTLTTFAKNLIAISPNQQRTWTPKLPVNNLLQVSNNKDWGKAWFENISTVAALSVLSKIQNDVLRSGNVVAEYFGSQVCIMPVILDKFDILINQNSTYLMQGETLEISAGIGNFSAAAKPTITIGGSRVAINENGVAIFRQRVLGKGGDIPVSVSFTDPNTGLPVTKTAQITYKVAPRE